jgi:hypothetical protein
MDISLVVCKPSSGQHSAQHPVSIVLGLPDFWELSLLPVPYLALSDTKFGVGSRGQSTCAEERESHEVFGDIGDIDSCSVVGNRASSIA